MPDNAVLTEAALEELMRRDETSLYLKLAGSVLAEPSAHEGRWQLVPDILEIDFGKEVFDRLQRKAYELICRSDKVSAEKRNRIVEAFGMKNDKNLIMMLTTALIPHLGIVAPAVALVAVLISRLLLESVHETLCEAWQKNLPTPNAQPGESGDAVRKRIHELKKELGVSDCLMKKLIKELDKKPEKRRKKAGKSTVDKKKKSIPASGRQHKP